MGLFCQFLQSPSLPDELHLEKEIILALAQCSFNNEDRVHVGLLFTFYHKMTGQHSEARFGPHWEEVGFQGSDPATDFRGVGLLGLLQPTAFTLSEATLAFLCEVLKLSKSPDQGFPFMVLSLNITSIVLNSLRNKHLDRLIRSKRSVVHVVNLFYGAVLLYIYDQWKTGNLNLVHSGQLLKKAETVCSKDVRQCIERFEKYLEKFQGQKLPPSEVGLEEVRLVLDQVHVTPP